MNVDNVGQMTRHIGLRAPYFGGGLVRPVLISVEEQGEINKCGHCVFSQITSQRLSQIAR